MKPETKPILFIDWDGTLSSGRFWSSLDASIYAKIQKYLFEDNRNLVQEWMRGKYTSEDICNSLINPTDSDFETLRQGLVQSCEAMNLSADVQRTLKQIRASHYLVLTTDNMDCFSRFTVPYHQLDNLFDEIINSATIGRLKGEGGGLTFTLAAKKYNVEIAHCRLIDDSSKTCEVFSLLGGIALKTSGVDHTLSILQSKPLEE